MVTHARNAVLVESGRPSPYAASAPIELWDTVLEDPGPGEVLVRVTAASVCHSDLSVVVGSRKRPLPMALGHEGAGVVQAVGEGVSDLREGDAVVMVFLPRCGQCEICLHGDGRVPCPVGSAANTAGTLLSGARRISAHGSPVHHHLGVSAFATHVVVDRRSLVPVPGDIPPAVAALLGCAMITGGGAVLNEIDIPSARSIAVVGLGGVGLSALLTARAVSSARIVAVDGVPAKRELALQLGADEALSPQEALESEPVDAVVEAAGVVPAFETAVRLTGIGGTTVTVGLPAPDAFASLSPLWLTSGARRVVGCYLGSSIPSRDIPRFEKLWREGRLPIEKLISHRMPLEDLNLAMDRLADGTALRQVVEL